MSSESKNSIQQANGITKISSLSIGIILLSTFACATGELSQPGQDLRPEQILKQLVPEVSKIRIIPAEELEPNPQGRYRRYAVVNGDFNQDGVEDIAIAGIDEWAQPPQRSLSRNGYVLIASKKKDGTWTRDFFHIFRGTANPFLIWDRERNALLVGANFADSDPGDIIWDRNEKRYKLVRAVEK